MIEMTAHFRAAARATLFFLAICLAGWAFVAEWRPEFAGLALGAAVSFANLIYLGWKVRKVGERATEGGRAGTIGFATRASLATLAALAAFRSEHLSVVAVIAALPFCPIAILLAGLWSSLRKKVGIVHRLR